MELQNMERIAKSSIEWEGRGKAKVLLTQDDNLSKKPTTLSLPLSSENNSTASLNENKTVSPDIPIHSDAYVVEIKKKKQREKNELVDNSDHQLCKNEKKKR